MADESTAPTAGWTRHIDRLRKRETWCLVDRMVRAWGPLLLILFAICYYGQYYRSDINLGGEGGTTAVIAMRLMEGQRPIVDTFLGYNVMWFWPVAWLFEVTGPNYIALSIYFFTICTISAVVGFLIVRRATNAGWLALGVGVVLILIPGMLFRNYMGLLPVLNAWAMLHAFVWEPRRPWHRWIRFAVAGLVLGLTFLIRIDVGMFLLVIYAGLVVLFPLGVRGGFLRRIPLVAGGAVVCIAAALLLHAPFYWHAQTHDYGPDFVGQYREMINKIIWEATKNVPGLATAEAPAEPRLDLAPPRVHGREITRVANNPNLEEQLAEIERQKEIEAGTRPRKDLANLFRQKDFYHAAFILALYLPILVSALIIVIAGCALLWALLTRNAALKEPALVSLVTLGCALTIFSQYFFFRPDTPHLSEFMISFFVAMACASFFAIRRALRARSWLLAVLCGAFVLLCVINEGLFFYHSFPKESAGTIEMGRKRSYELKAQNGVHVLVRRREQPWMQKLHDVVFEHSDPDDWVVTFPYSPTINFMTNRRSYLRNLYVDNASLPKDWANTAIDEIKRFRPAVIVIDQRDINDTEESRFRNWAAPVDRFIRHHYIQVGEFGDFDENEIFVRPDKIPPSAWRIRASDNPSA